jgi:hypothetical protein
MQVRASNSRDGRREAGGVDCCERSLDRAVCIRVHAESSQESHVDTIVNLGYRACPRFFLSCIPGCSLGPLNCNGNHTSSWDML